jgi:ribosome-associated translation inhibitor RaiA
MDRFPSLKDCTVYVALEMHNSSVPARPDLFTVKVYMSDGRYRGVRLEKSGQNLYAALEEAVEHTIEKLNRLDDRRRVILRHRARELIAIAEIQGIRRKLFW